MPDLREQLRKIEAAEPPHLWAGIEARAREEGPQMDTNVTSIAAFRAPGWEGRRRLAAGLVAAAVVGLVAVIAWQSFQPATTTLPFGSVPNGWVRCTNEVLGYSIGYPDTWHTTDVLNGDQDPAHACRWFSPDPFGREGNVVTEGWGYPLEVRIGGPLEREVRQTLDPEVARVVAEEELVVDGHPAVRLEYETLVDLVADTGLHYQYVIELDPRTTLIVHTTETRGIEGDYEDNRTIVDTAVESVRFTTTGA